MSFGANAGVTEEFRTDAISEGIANPSGMRGGIHGFYERPDGTPTFQAIDDSTYMHLLRKGRVAYFGANAPLEMGVHRTMAWTVNGRRVKPLEDIEILRAFVEGKTVAGLTPSPEVQAKAREWLGRLYAPYQSDRQITHRCGCGAAFGSRFALEAHAMACAAPAATNAASSGTEAGVAVPTAAAFVAKPPKPFNCRRCAIVFDSHSELGRHQASVHGAGFKKRSA